MSPHKTKFFAAIGLILTLGAGSFVSPPTAHAAPMAVASCAELNAQLSAAGAAPLELSLTAAFATEVSSAGVCSAQYAATGGVVIDGSGITLTNPTGQVLALTNTAAATITLRNLTVVDALGTGSPAVRLVNSATGVFQILNSTFKNVVGTVITADGSGSITLENSVFRDNSKANGADLGRVLIISGSMSSTITRSTFENNSAGGIVYRSSGSSVAAPVKHLVDHSNFIGNTLTFTALPVMGSCISDSVRRGAALYVSCGANVDFVTRYSVFSANKVMGTSDVVSSAGPNNRIDAGAILVNSAAQFGINVLIEDSLFRQNFAQDDGGAILVEGGLTVTQIKSRIVNSTFTENTVAGAQYGGQRFGLKVAVTDGSGGAVAYFGMTESEITHSFFYKNGITSVMIGTGITNMGSVGGGGAVAVLTDEAITDPSALPPVPVLSNNIFLANYHNNIAPQAAITLINAVTSSALSHVHERINSGNVFVLPGTDADIQGSDPRGLTNNGNIGYDNNCGRVWQASAPNWVGTCDWDNQTGSGNRTNALGTNTAKGIVAENVFESGAAVLKPFADRSGIGGNERAGASGAEAELLVYPISPRTDEIYRDGSEPYYDAAVQRDTRGFVRDKYPNAGPVEIYWTKFDPGAGAGGRWTASIPAGAIQSIANPLIYYTITDPLQTLLTFPRSAIENSDPDAGFLGWLSDQPSTPGGTDYSLYQPWYEIQSTKQKLTAQWQAARYRVDFDLGYDVVGVRQWGTPLLGVAKGSLITAPQPTRAGFTFMGWFKDAGYGASWDFGADTVTKDTMLYAAWKELPKLYRVDFDLGYDVAGVRQWGTPLLDVPAGSLITASQPTRAGFTFTGWFKDAGYGASWDFDADTVTSDTVLYAAWDEKVEAPTGGTVPSDNRGVIAALVIVFGISVVGVARRAVPGALRA
ncbi:MAG: InlB B-repeat-containing protein [Propionibacteriaceae bacterium]|jgi:uncharacterized repeat protein (TIGR02543 family)|nr:InlB B-repeat-containing protein [Propionibacteriaceae bacterium]